MPHFPNPSRPGVTLGPSLDLLDTWNARGFSPSALWLAAAGEQPAGVVQALRSASPDEPGIDAVDPDEKWSALMMLLMQPPMDGGRRTGRVPPYGLDDAQRAAMRLLDTGADPFMTDRKGLSAVVHGAVHNAGAWLVDLIREHSTLDRLQAVRIPRNHLHGWTSLNDPDLMTYLLIKQGPGVDALLDVGWPVNTIDAEGVPLLHRARSLLDLQRLLNAGADSLAVDAQSRSAAMAFTRGVEDTDTRNRMLSLLATAQEQRLKDDPSQLQRWRRMEFEGLFHAIGTATKDTFVKLFRNVVVGSAGDLSADTPSVTGVRLLEEAWRQEKLPIVTYLLDQGANPLLPGSHGLPVWLGHLAMGPVPLSQNSKDAIDRQKRDTERRQNVLQQVFDAHQPDVNARLPDGRSLLLGLIAGFENLAPTFEQALERERPGRRPKALWWAVDQLLKKGADPHVRDRVSAFPMMDGDEQDTSRDLRWPVALAVGVVPALTGSAPSPEHMGVGSAHEVSRLLKKALPIQDLSRAPVPIVSAWFATLVGGYHCKASNGALRDAPTLLEPWASIAEMPPRHPLAQHSAWQADVQRASGPFARVLEQNALRRVAQEAAAEGLGLASVGRRRL